MPSGFNNNGLHRLETKLRSLTHIDFQPLMEAWEVVLQEDNVKGVLEGLDGFGKPLAPVTYRPKPATGKEKLDVLRYNNLHSSHYKILGGPPLAPRGVNSRVITNFRTAWAHFSDRWLITWAWEDVVDTKGVAFLGFHFRGEGRLPVRDLRPPRPRAVKQCRQALRDYMDYLLSSQPPSSP